MDIMTFLHDEYCKELAKRTEERKDKRKVRPSVIGFVNFARKYLAEINQPLNVTYLQKGLGLRLQQGETVSFVPQNDNVRPMYDEGIPISRPKTMPMMHGVVDISGVSILSKD